MHWVAADSATLARARASAERAWMLDSTLLDSRLARAGYLTEAGDPEAAHAVASAAAAAAPGVAAAQLRLAEVEDALGRPERGIASAERAVVLDPRSPEPPAVLAGLYQKTYRYAESIRARERELALVPRNTAAYWTQTLSYLGWRADTAGARRVVERGGPAFEAWLVRLPNDPGVYLLWHDVSGPTVRRAKDTLSFAGYLAHDGGFPPELYLFMKLRHFAFSARPALARAYADSAVAQLEPALRRAPDVDLFNTYSRRAGLAAAYARLGRGGDGAREIDRHVAESRHTRLTDAVPVALVNAAYVDVLIGRRDLAVARLAEALRMPAGYVISRALLRAEPAWAPLRGRPDFERLLAGD
jgi:tetratricopeptide (TPR) repeat protein